MDNFKQLSICLRPRIDNSKKKENMIETKNRQLKEKEHEIASRDNTIQMKERESRSRHSNSCNPQHMSKFKGSQGTSDKNHESRNHCERKAILNLIVTKDRQLQENQETSKELDRHFGISWRLELSCLKKQKTLLMS